MWNRIVVMEEDHDRTAARPQPTGNPAETDDRFFVPAMVIPWTSELLRRAAPRSGERVFDIACGMGVVARQVAPW